MTKDHTVYDSVYWPVQQKCTYKTVSEEEEKKFLYFSFTLYFLKNIF